MMLHRSILAAAMLVGCNAFNAPSTQSSNTVAHQSSHLYMASVDEKPTKKKEGYVPKWKKKATLAELTGTGELAAEEKGLAGTVPIKFQMGKGEDATFIETTAMPGQSLKLVASQAGQYIKYGCGKGECGTCESLCNGKYLRPCVDVVPTDLDPDADGRYDQLVIQVKGTKAKVVSSGKFFSVKSFLLGFWNNLLGMGGFVRDRRKAKKNWQERIDNEDEIMRLTLEKKRKRAEEAAKKNA
ncbi:hypothetical protein ACHAXR_012640 [Thalassiosira sp. AJA248-18]